MKESGIERITKRYLPTTYCNPIWGVRARRELRELKAHHKFYPNFKLLRALHILLCQALAMPILARQKARSADLKKYLLSQLSDIKMRKCRIYPTFYESIMLRELVMRFGIEGEFLRDGVRKQNHYVVGKIAHNLLATLPEDKGGHPVLEHKKQIIKALIKMYTEGTGLPPKYKWLDNGIYSGGFYLFLLDVNELFKLVADFDIGLDITIGQYLKEIAPKKNKHLLNECLLF